MKLRANIISLIFVIVPFWSYSQTEEIECLKIFNSIVYDNLLNIDTNNVDVSSNNVTLIFELYVSECGKIDSAIVKKSNLSNLAICETAVLSSVIGKKIPCLRGVYYKGELLPDKIIIVYNTKMLEDK
jgi:hypothetical protein